MTPIPIFLSDALIDALALDGLTPDTYRPSYGGESVGLDLYNIGSDLVIEPASSMLNQTSLEEWLDLEDSPAWLDSPERLRKQYFKKLMPTGIYTAIPTGYVGIIKERGSVTKTPVLSRAGVIDPGYSGEIFVNMVNVSSSPFTIAAKTKSPFQLIMVAVSSHYEPISKDDFDLLHSNAQRAGGKIGSSD